MYVLFNRTISWLSLIDLSLQAIMNKLLRSLGDIVVGYPCVLKDERTVWLSPVHTLSRYVRRRESMRLEESRSKMYEI